ncbi:hypothetical protein TorRG33x02_243670, partial [Trema orientale]
VLCRNMEKSPRRPYQKAGLTTWEPYMVGTPLCYRLELKMLAIADNDGDIKQLNIS